MTVDESEHTKNMGKYNRRVFLRKHLFNRTHVTIIKYFLTLL